MDDRYDAYCAVDPLFYDSLAGGRRPNREFAAASLPPPAGWQQQVVGDWLAYGPDPSPLPPQGWKIHVSACLDNAERLLDQVITYCFPRGLTFKFLRGPDVLLMHNSKYAPRGASGKFITIYPINDAELAQVCKDLAELLRGEAGPYILSDLRIGDGPLYVRYGGFAAKFCLADGDLVPAIAEPDGTLVPDRRNPVFTVPDWVTLPEFLTPHLAARNAATTSDLPYQIERVIHFSNGGGLYAATDTRTGQRCVLKEARPHAGLDATGADAVSRLRREREMLERLADIPQVPRVHDHFTLGEHHFLALEFIDGQSLNKLLVQRYPLTDADADAAAVASYTRWALDIHQQVSQAITAIHDRGIVYGDLHLFNLMVRPDGRVALVDFEVAAPADQQHRPGLRNQGFAAPSDRTGIAVDQYALACLGLALFLPLTQLVRLMPAMAAQLAASIAEHFPVPAPFLASAIQVITGTEPPPPVPRQNRSAASDPTQAPVDPPRLEPDPAGWQWAREQLVGAITAAATPHRDDRLFPGDIDQFRTGGLNLAHGAAGVLYALAVSGADRHPDHEQWLVSRALRPEPGTRCGFYDGLHGVAYVLAQWGRRSEALDVLEICLREPWRELPPNLHSGVAGIGLNLAHLAESTGETSLHDAARHATALVVDRLADRDTPPPRYAGLSYGDSGQALLLLRQYERTGDSGLLDSAAVALRRDLARCVVREDGAMELDEGWRTMPYLSRGSVGVGVVLDQYLAHRLDDQFVEASAAIRRAARSPFYAQSGLFAGRAGILLYLAHRPDRAAESAEIAAQVRRLAWHAVPYQGFLAFPGDQLLRLSMDLATGTAGVLLALGAALHDQPVDLPFLGPIGPMNPPARKGSPIHHPHREEVFDNGTSRPPGNGAVRR